MTQQQPSQNWWQKVWEGLRQNGEQFLKDVQYNLQKKIASLLAKTAGAVATALATLYLIGFNNGQVFVVVGALIGILSSLRAFLSLRVMAGVVTLVAWPAAMWFCGGFFQGALVWAVKYCAITGVPFYWAEELTQRQPVKEGETQKTRVNFFPWWPAAPAIFMLILSIVGLFGFLPDLGGADYIKLDEPIELDSSWSLPFVGNLSERLSGLESIVCWIFILLISSLFMPVEVIKLFGKGKTDGRLEQTIVIIEIWNWLKKPFTGGTAGGGKK